MNNILKEIQKIINENMALYLPHVNADDLEEGGEVFYMNGKNGTEFDWYVNDHISNFMIFYNDKDNLGAAKLILYIDGGIELYLYDERGKKMARSVQTRIEAEEADLLRLAVILKTEADDRQLWDAGIGRINSDVELSDESVKAFKDHKEHYAAMKNRMNILNLKACVSMRILEEGWKVGYMERGRPHAEEDSGWIFLAGDEDNAYLSNHKNLQLVDVGYVWQQLDNDILQYIDMPAGSKLIRISSKEFEIDRNDKPIYMQRRI
ncbi:MAG: DUF2185 domain-containing protein [Butyrivibrio sp.]|nr:DUF2185 domain-containing protein [Muribaculum sp.]MCM1552202.1 DUF2185 domain-containing protein [Butyrivibrio sp.]